MKNKELHTKKDGFNTPKDYFNSFEERLFDRINTETVIPKASGFTTPDAYFDRLEDKLSDEVFASKEQTLFIYEEFSERVHSRDFYLWRRRRVRFKDASLYVNHYQ